MSEANSSPGDGPSGPSHSAPAPISHDDSSEDNGNENALFANAKTGRTPSEDGDRPNENASDGDGDAGLFGSEPEDEGTGYVKQSRLVENIDAHSLRTVRYGSSPTRSLTLAMMMQDMIGWSTLLRLTRASTTLTGTNTMLWTPTSLALHIQSLVTAR